MKSLYESILSSTNAGKKSLVRAWLEEYGFKNYTINDKCEIDVNDRVDLRVYDFETFPSYIQFGTVKGDFYWNDKIASLEGAPKKVGGNFYCSNNNLTSLKGAPKEVGKDFYCNNNNLTTLEGAPMKVGGSFYCWKNQLTSLIGAPREVVGRFDCSDNNLTSLKGAPKKVGGNFYCNNNNLTSLKGAPKEVGWCFDCTGNKLTSLEGAPKEASYFKCGNNTTKFTKDDVKKVCKVEDDIYV